MIFHRLIIAVFFSIFLCLGQSQAAPLEAYGKLPTMEEVEISPDGTHLAFIKQLGEDRAVLIWSIAEQKVIRVIVVNDVKFRMLQWVDSNWLVLGSSLSKSFSGNGYRWEYYNAHLYDIAKSEVSILARNAWTWPDVRYVDGEPALFFEDGGDLMRKTRAKSRPVEVASADNVQDWFIDEKGEVIARSDFMRVSERWMLRIRSGGGWPAIFEYPAPIDSPSIAGLSPDGSAIIIKLIEDGDVIAKAIDIETHKVLPDYDTSLFVDGIIRDDFSERIIGTVKTREHREWKFFNPDDQRVWDSVIAAFPGSYISFQSWTTDRKKIVVRVLSPDYGDVYLLVDFEAKRADPIGYPYDEIPPEDIAEVKTIKYKAADGLELYAYLTYPPGRDLKNLPLVVNPHGGPHSRDYPSFDWWAQAMAARGYLVLQPQFRGSGGWGREYYRAGWGEYGRKMQSDLSDGVRELVSEGLVDPARVCIVGASYGGYAALAGTFLDKGVYRCAVSVAGMSDMVDFFEDVEDARFDPTLRYWERYVGKQNRTEAALKAISPVYQVDKIDVPILLVHGRDDSVVRIKHSRAMNEALKAAGKDVEFVELDGEDHHLSRSETRLQMLTAVVGFLEKHNPPQLPH